MKPLRVSGDAVGKRASALSGLRARQRKHPHRLFTPACNRTGQHTTCGGLAATTQVALAYVQGPECAGARAASKHFPLRRGTAEATHPFTFTPRTRWAGLPPPHGKPFQEVSKQSDAATPPAHVILVELGIGYPVVSSSRRIARQVIRDGRGCKGVLVAGAGAVRATFDRWPREAGTDALNARLDLLPIAFDPCTSFDAMHGAPRAVRQAAQRGALDAPKRERRGARRLQSFR